MGWDATLPGNVADIEKYERLSPGFTSRLIEMAEREQKYNHRTILIGQISALVVALAFLLASVYLVGTGHDVAGTILGTVDIVALVAAFITVGGSRSKNEPASLEAPLQADSA